MPWFTWKLELVSDILWMVVDIYNIVMTSKEIILAYPAYLRITRLPNYFSQCNDKVIVLYFSSFLQQFQINRNIQRLEKVCAKIADVLQLSWCWLSKWERIFSRFFFYFIFFVLVIFNVNFCLVYFFLWAFTGLAGITFTDLDTW